MLEATANSLAVAYWLVRWIPNPEDPGSRPFHDIWAQNILPSHDVYCVPVL